MHYTLLLCLLYNCYKAILKIISYSLLLTARLLPVIYLENCRGFFYTHLNSHSLFWHSYKSIHFYLGFICSVVYISKQHSKVRSSSEKSFAFFSNGMKLKNMMMTTELFGRLSLKRFWSWTDGSVRKVLGVQTSRSDFDSRTHFESQMWLLAFVTPVLARWRQQIFEACWPTGLVYPASFRYQEEIILEKSRGTYPDLLPTNVCCVLTHIHCCVTFPGETCTNVSSSQRGSCAQTK